jgi:transglutaminase-like putative cysteine protease
MEPLTVVIILIPFTYNIGVFSNKLPMPGRKTLLFLTVLFTFILAFSFRELFSRDAGIPLLIIMSLFKILEIKNLRDELVACFLSFFILLSLILFSSSLFTTLYMFFAAVFTVAVMGYINSSDKNFKASIKKSLYISAPSILLAFILFFFFPRIQGNLWGKKDFSKNVSGFAQTISPGSVSSLVKNDQLAFKIKYNDEDAKKADYFRGIVFNHFDGREWTPDKPPKQNTNTSQTDKSNLKSGFIILYPTNSRYLIAPGYPLESPERGIYLTQGFVLYSKYFKISRKKMFEIKYSYKNPYLPVPEKKHFKLPENYNPETLKLASEWKNLPSEMIIEKGIDLLKNNNFEYTLNPPVYGTNYIDEFLFKDKKGFCEHFASSFAFLMRAAGVPARIIGGYLGGEKNNVGDFMNVRQSDAHAWCEVWLEDKGWIQIDPTSEADPRRLDQNTEELFTQDFNQNSRFESYYEFIEPITNIIDALNFYWNQNIMGFNFNLQKKLLEFLGVKNQNFIKKTAVFVASILAGIILIKTGFIIRKKIGMKKDPEVVLFEKFQKKMHSKNLSKNESEGFLSYIKRIKNSGIENSEDIKEFVNSFISARYRHKKDYESIKKMKEILKKI